MQSLEFPDGPVRRPGAPARTETLVVKITEEGMKAIDALARREDRNRSDMVRILLRRGMESAR